MGCTTAKPALRRQGLLDEEAITRCEEEAAVAVRHVSKSSSGKNGSLQEEPRSSPYLSLPFRTKGRPVAVDAKVRELLNASKAQEPFSRRKCVFEPERATASMEPYAMLELSIHRARDLLRSTSCTLLRQRGASVKAYVDDIYQYETEHVHSSVNRFDWEHEGTVNITAPRSMIRLHVFDKETQHDLDDTAVMGDTARPSKSVGFVEFCVGDIPWNQEIEGWLEIRFPANLQGSNSARYAEHCAHREEEAHREHGHSNLHPEEDNGEDEEDNDWQAMLGTVQKQARRTKPLTGRIARQLRKFHHRSPTRSPISPSGGEYRYNAGELFVRMRLTMLRSRWDHVFALALEPSYAFFDYSVQQDDMTEVSLQEITDDVFDIKYAVLDDFFIPVVNYASYILWWRSFSLTFMVVFGISLGFVGPEGTGYIAAWSLALLVMVLQAKEEFRLNMTTGGMNAPLSQKGLERVARWQDTEQMHQFLLRVVASRGGMVKSEHDLRCFILHIFKPNQSLPGLETIVEALHLMDWVDMHPSPEYKTGSLVRVDERQRAFVMSKPVADGRLLVHYEDPGNDVSHLKMRHNWLHPHRSEPQGLVEVEASRIAPRVVVPRVPKAVLPRMALAWIGAAGFRVEMLRRVTVHWCGFISDILTWRRPMAMLCMCGFFALRVVLEFLHLFRQEDEVALAITVRVLRSIKEVLFASALGYILLCHSPVCGFVGALFRICHGLATEKRCAPEGWAFFKQDNRPEV